MALKDRISVDNMRVFMNMGQFASEHTWNGMKITCVTDEEEAIKRKNNNVNDISWDNNLDNLLIHIPLSELRRRPEPNTHILFDGKDMKVLSCQDNMGMLDIELTAQSTRELI